MDEIWQAIFLHKELTALVALSILTTILLWVFWERASFWLFNQAYGLPLVGKLSRISSQLDRPQGDEWFLAEKTLCSDYSRWIRSGNQITYENAKKYLAKADDAKSKPTPLFFWLVLVVLVFAEAVTFAYAFAPYFASGDISPNEQKVIALSFAMIIGSFSLFIMHSAGEDLHRNRVISRCMTQWRSDKNKKGSLDLRTVSLGDSQSTDDDMKHYEQTMNRVGSDKHKFWLSVAISVLLVIGAASYYVRYKNIVDGKCQTTSATFSFQQGEETGKSSTIDQPGADAAQAACIVLESPTALVAAGMMAFVFIAVQLLGIGWGMKYSFVGNDSENAYKITGSGRFLSYQAYHDFVFVRIADIAQARLIALRQMMQVNGSNHGEDLKFANQSFHDFFIESQRKNTLSSSNSWNWATRQGAVSEKAVSAEDIRNMISQGKLLQTDKVKREGNSNWTKIQDVKEFAANAPDAAPTFTTFEGGRLAKVVGIAGQHKDIAEEISFDKPILMGRDSQSQIVFATSDVSSRHCQLSFEPSKGVVTLLDLGSSNGTFFKGTRLPKNGKVELVSGDSFYLVDPTNQFKIEIA